MSSENKKDKDKPEYSATVIMPNGLIKINTAGVVEVVGPLTADEMAVAATISQCLTKLRNGKISEFVIEPDSYNDGSTVIKGQWMARSGNLLKRGVATKMYNFVTTIEEALASTGVFTCEEKLFNLLPKKREVTIGDDWKAGIKGNK